MRQIKRLFSIYSIDFWIFIISDCALTTAACCINSRVGNPKNQVYILLFAFMTVLCVLLTQPNRKFGLSPLSWLATKAGEKFSSSFSLIQLNNYQSHILILASLSVVLAFRMAHRSISGNSPLILIAYGLFLTVVLISLYIGVTKSFSEMFARIMIVFSMIFPIVLDLFLDRYSHGHLPDAYAWIIISVVFSMFMASKQAPRIFFKLFICMLFIGLICVLSFLRSIDVIKTMEIIANIFSVGFVIFASLEFYMAHSIQNYLVLEDIYEELKNTQTQLVQKEQMVTLGQLIAGVAHEINTPIGAIKSSAETLSSAGMGKMFREIRRCKDNDSDAVLTILEMSSKSVRNMRSTTEIRRGRTQIREYLESIDIPNAAKISAVLSGMDICDIEKVEDNIDIFRRENIMDILLTVRELFTYISSIQNIQFASNKVAKIVFALRSFSHMNMSGAEVEFDVVQNIDNVLVLYENQLKRGVEIIRRYDENVQRIYGNIEEIGQVWTNIAQNAIHAMSYVGKLTISVKGFNDVVQVSFTDTGPGISPENIDKIFTPFFTTKPLGEGSGLGLDICKKIVAKHKGDISVKSKPGQGTTFTVTLPVKRESGTGVL